MNEQQIYATHTHLVNAHRKIYIIHALSLSLRDSLLFYVSIQQIMQHRKRCKFDIKQAKTEDGRQLQNKKIEAKESEREKTMHNMGPFIHRTAALAKRCAQLIHPFSYFARIRVFFFRCSCKPLTPFIKQSTATPDDGDAVCLHTNRSTVFRYNIFLLRSSS